MAERIAAPGAVTFGLTPPKAPGPRLLKKAIVSLKPGEKIELFEAK